MKKIFIILWFCLLTTPAFAWNPGTTGSQFLKLGIGSRPVAMGEAYTAVSDDANGLYWNPAGLREVPNFEISATFMTLFYEVSYTAGALVIPMRNRGNFALGVAYLTTKDTRRNELGQEEGNFTNYDLAITGGYAVKLFERLQVGGSCKLIRSKLEEETASTVTFDCGLLSRIHEYIFAGAVIRHLGPGIKFIDKWDRAPTNLRGGIAFKLPMWKHHLILATDLSAHLDVEPTLSFGGEFKFKFPRAMESKISHLSIRMGYKTGYHLGEWSGFSLGVGTETELKGLGQLVIDVVHFSYGFLGSSERASLTIKF